VFAGEGRIEGLSFRKARLLVIADGHGLFGHCSCLATEPQLGRPPLRLAQRSVARPTAPKAPFTSAKRELGSQVKGSADFMLLRAPASRLLGCKWGRDANKAE
jgi:hypothetical protein